MVEFAVILPVLLTLILGTIEVGRSMQASTVLNAAVREGGRLASMDFTEYVTDDQTANQKVEADIKNFITASGLPGDKVTVLIRKVGPGLGGQTFDLQDPSNNLAKFRIILVLNQSEVSMFPFTLFSGNKLRARAVFRAVRTSISS